MASKTENRFERQMALLLRVERVRMFDETLPIEEIPEEDTKTDKRIDLLPALKREDSSVGNPTSSITPAVNLRVC